MLKNRPNRFNENGKKVKCKDIYGEIVPDESQYTYKTTDEIKDLVTKKLEA